MKQFKKALTLSTLLIGFFSIASGSPIYAAPTTPKDSSASSEARKVQSEENSSDQFRLGLGYSFFGGYSKTGEIGSLSSVFDLNSIHSLQIFFGVGAVSNSFNFGTGLTYRATISGDRNLGLHLGALMNIGTTGPSEFIAQMGPLLGIHMALFQLPQLQLSLDGGPMFRYWKGPDFRLSPLGGGMLGASIHYFL